MIKPTENFVVIAGVLAVGISVPIVVANCKELVGDTPQCEDGSKGPMRMAEFFVVGSTATASPPNGDLSVINTITGETYHEKSPVPFHLTAIVK